jgi:arylsulfatase A-like enzyme
MATHAIRGLTPPARRILRALFTLVTLLLAHPPVGAGETKTKPNVLFIMSDDMRPDLACYGNQQVRSPNIDRLASRGVRFDRAYCQFPLCNPSRSSMLTGRLPTTTKVLDNTAYFRDINPDFVTLPEFFRARGYVTLRVGKIYHGGIDDEKSWTEGGEPRKEKKPVDPKQRIKNSDRIVVLEGDGETHGDYKTADGAIALLRKYKDRPFFLACGFNRPHSPLTAPQKFLDLYDPAKIDLPKNFAPRPTTPPGYPKGSVTQNGDLFIQRDASEADAREMIRAYWASVSWTDWNVGRVLAELERLGLAENTIVVFWGDHGYHLGEFGKWSKHGSLFEVGTRVPLIIAAPAAKGNGQSSPRPVQAIDIYPTLCESCGLTPPAGLEGHSLKRLLDEPQAEWEHPAFSVHGNAKKAVGLAVRTQRYRYVEYDGGQGGAMLFDHTKDPHELRNLADDPALAGVRQELSSVLRKRFGQR